MNAATAEPQIAPSDLTPFALGSAVTDRDGLPSPLCRSLFAPFWVCVDGVVVANYGDDEEAAEAHYAPLRLALRKRMGWPIQAIDIAKEPTPKE